MNKMENAKSMDIAMLIYGFGMLEFGSESLWHLFNEQVETRFDDLSHQDFDMIIQGYRSDVPFDKGSAKLREMFSQRIMSQYKAPEDFIVVANSFIGNHGSRGNQKMWDLVEAKFTEYMNENHRLGVFVSKFLKLMNKANRSKALT